MNSKMTMSSSQRGVWAGCRLTASVVIALLGATWGAYTGVVLSGQSTSGSAKSVWDDVYTDAQATRGKDLFTKNCAVCHGDDLLGGSDAPALVGETFVMTWTDKSLDDLFGSIRNNMPLDNPSSLTNQTYIDIIAFILRSNTFPAGQEELAPNSESLKGILITKAK